MLEALLFDVFLGTLLPPLGECVVVKHPRVGKARVRKETVVFVNGVFNEIFD